MLPTAAETARTLATGRLPGRLWVPELPRDLPVAHATTAGGQVLIAAHRGSRAWLSLAVNGDDAACVLTIDDAPPFPDSPRLGRIHLCGWISRVIDSDLHRTGLEFATSNPIDDLLDLGAGLDLFRLELGEVRLERPDPQRSGAERPAPERSREVLLEKDEFEAASPDPLHPHERQLLQDLRDHHADDLAALVPGPPRRCRPVRLDRHGLVLATPGLYRIDFPYPADRPCCVARALQLSVDHP